MKKLIIALAALVAVGCSKSGDDLNNNGKEPENSQIESIELQRPTEDMVMGSKYQMTVNATPNVDGLTFEWSSSNTDVATISQSGLLEAQSEGVTIITALYRPYFQHDNEVIFLDPIISKVDVYVYGEKPIPQDYTSFITVNSLSDTLYKCVFGYFDADGYCWKLAELEDLAAGQQSQEIVVEDEDITEIYLYDGGYKVIYPFVIEKHKKNIFVIKVVGAEGLEWVGAGNTKYPQDKKVE